MSLRSEMKRALKAYGEVLRLVRRLPEDSRPYYAKYARENFVNYREVDSNDPSALQELFNRTYKHSLWVLNKYSVDEAAADKLKGICCNWYFRCLPTVCFYSQKSLVLHLFFLFQSLKTIDLMNWVYFISCFWFSYLIAGTSFCWDKLRWCVWIY